MKAHRQYSIVKCNGFLEQNPPSGSIRGATGLLGQESFRANPARYSRYELTSRADFSPDRHEVRQCTQTGNLI